MTRPTEELINILQDATEDVELRRDAAWELGASGNVVGIEPLRQALAESDWEIRFAAIEALGQLSATAAIPDLKSLLSKVSNESEKRVISKAIELINQTNQPTLV